MTKASDKITVANLVRQFRRKHGHPPNDRQRAVIDHACELFQRFERTARSYPIEDVRKLIGVFKPAYRAMDDVRAIMR